MNKACKNWAQVSDQVHVGVLRWFELIEPEVRVQVRDQIRDQVHDQIRGEVWAHVCWWVLELNDE